MLPPDVSEVFMTYRSQASKGKWENKEDFRVEIPLAILFPEGLICNWVAKFQIQKGQIWNNIKTNNSNKK